MTPAPVSQTNRLLGYPDDARLLIVNADDLGICRAANAAIFDALTAGVVTSTSLMIPWRGAAEAIEWLRDNPDLDFGVHLTVICDNPRNRWGPVSPRERVPSLMDENGDFYGIERRSEFLAQAALGELELEFRAQIEAALDAGIKPTHLDWHCLLDGGRADVFDLTVGLALDYGLAIRAMTPTASDAVRRRHLPVNDHDVLDSYSLEVAGKSAYYAKLLRTLPTGLSEWAVHPATGDDEMKALEPESWQVRHSDADFVMSPEAREIIRQEGIILIGYRPLQALWQNG